MTRLRARIAERLVTAQATQALLTTFNEVDLLAVQRAARPLQGQIREEPWREARLLLVLRAATIEALKRFPSSMRRWMAMTSSTTSTTTSAWRSPRNAASSCRCCVMPTC
jgi:pyruvate/2-oxoglutarate dehydrogenase complex dihydrolipoamide acyltransferase (E2) component